MEKYNAKADIAWTHSVCIVHSKTVEQETDE